MRTEHKQKLLSLLAQEKTVVHTLPKVISDAEARKLAGTFCTDDSYDLLVTSNADVVDAETGKAIIRFRKNVLPENFCKDAYKALQGVPIPMDNRGIAAGWDHKKVMDYVKLSGAIDYKRNAPDSFRFKLITRDGKLSNTSRGIPVRSGVVGYFDRSTRFPYCRQTAFNKKEFAKFKKAYPLIKRVDEYYSLLCPEAWEAQNSIAQETEQAFVIRGTSFTTVTVNKNWQTAIHTDKGDYEKGFGNLVALRAGETFSGGYLCMPQWRVAVDVESYDILYMDVHQWHGNTPFHGDMTKSERLSLVMYYRNNMQFCGTPAEEQELAKRRKGGDKVYQELEDSPYE